MRDEGGGSSGRLFPSYLYRSCFSWVRRLASDENNVASGHVGKRVPTQVLLGAPRAAPRGGHGGKAVREGAATPPHHACRVPESCPRDAHCHTYQRHCAAGIELFSISKRGKPRAKQNRKIKRNTLKKKTLADAKTNAAASHAELLSPG